ncbi:uncharacterized protein [Diadema antillarum]|uniref:uncharacterized protein n=1 Tax=Diadema antillarum TaxID=105358 RepID=UPI003A899106
MSGYPDMHTAPGSQQLIQRCVIVQRDEKGFGLTVTGDNPVFIQSVKDHGAAYKAGVQTGDRIIKVNGTLVTSSNHLEVVQMIKSAGPYVALTLLGRPPGTSNVAPQTPPPPILNPALPPSGSQPTDSKRIVTSPLPVNPSPKGVFQFFRKQYNIQQHEPTQDAQVKSERLNTFKRMLDQERTLLDHTQREYSQNPSEKLQKDISGIKTRISVLEKQLQKAHSNMIHTQGSGTPPAVHPASPASTARPLEGQVASSNASHPWDSPNMNEEFQTIPEEQKKNEKPAESRRSWLSHGIQHTRQRSSPETYNLPDHNSPSFLRSVSAGLKRNNSDAQCKESSARQKFRDRGSSGTTVQPLDRNTKRKELEAIGRVKSLPGDTLEGDYDDLDTSFSGASSPGVVHGMETVTPMEGVEEARLVQDPVVSAQLQTATVDTVELCSPPTLAAEVHSVPAPSQSHSQSQSAKIMCMDEDDFQSDNEAVSLTPSVALHGFAAETLPAAVKQELFWLMLVDPRQMSYSSTIVSSKCSFVSCSL